MASRSKGRRTKRRAVETPVTSSVFWISLAATALCLAVIVWLVVANVPDSRFRPWIRGLILLVFAISGVSSLAVTEIIPWRSRSWAEWRRPKVLGAVAGLMVGAAGVVASLGPVFNPPAAEQGTQLEMRKTLERTSVKVDALERVLHERFPDDPPILRDIPGTWGDLEPACAVVWKIEIVQRAGRAALIAQTTRVPKGVKAYVFVGEIITADGNTLSAEGVEPAEARGAVARFELNPATSRLSWDDRSRGSGGVEIYRPCP